MKFISIIDLSKLSHSTTLALSFQKLTYTVFASLALSGILKLKNTPRKCIFRHLISGKVAWLEELLKNSTIDRL